MAMARVNDAESVARRFAAALDAADWDAVSALLDDACAYHMRGATTTGVESIVGSYRTIDEWVKATFDSVRYESRVEAQPDGTALITFRDRIDQGAHALDHRCQQRIAVDDAGRITTITHIDLEGEAEKVARFNAACGVVKPG